MTRVALSLFKKQQTSVALPDVIMGSLFDKKVLLINLSIILFLLLYFYELKEFIPNTYRLTTSIIICISIATLFKLINRKYRRTKRFGEKLKLFFHNQGYELLEERPMNFFETFEHRIKLTTIDILGIPFFYTNSFAYYGINQRVFKAKKIHSGNEWELYCEIFTTWNKRINLTIIKENRL